MCACVTQAPDQLPTHKNTHTFVCRFTKCRTVQVTRMITHNAAQSPFDKGLACVCMCV